LDFPYALHDDGREASENAGDIGYPVQKVRFQVVTDNGSRQAQDRHKTKESPERFENSPVGKGREGRERQDVEYGKM
jgi:hypothetical protein